ncbi:MAG: nucleoside recognition domain-containing protein [Bacteroidales bacterium]|nr:nucleoside recognition domain-containing protein [Bacteroidales bacterium]MDY5194100.1 nucleoside recognition domain-containing protein [Candidatus Aphodosoma sp.]
MKFFQKMKFTTRRSVEAIIFLLIFFGIFGFIGSRMGMENMMNTIMRTAHDLLLYTVLYLMGITVLSGALGKLLVEFGVVRLLEKILRPLMKPLFNLPGVAALGAVLTFLSDNPAIISLANDKNFSSYFKKYQLISLTNFGTAFGMGLIVLAFMTGKGYGSGALIGLLGSVVGSIISTRLMQRFVLKSHPEYDAPVVENVDGDSEKISFKSDEGVFLRGLNAILEGGKTGVDLGLAIIPGVLVISTFVMILTFGPNSDSNTYTGAAYEGVRVLPYLAGKIDFIFKWLFGFEHPELVAFPITALGAVGAALGLIPTFIEQNFIDGNVIAVFTAMGMCWSGFLSTHTAMLDSLGYRHLTSKAIIAHTIGGFCAGIAAHLFFMLYQWIFL